MSLIFKVKNIANKDIVLYRKKILQGQTYDLMNLNWINKFEIKDSISRGLLKKRLEYQDIEIIQSNLNLVTFDVSTQSFLTSLGINIGVIPETSTNGYVYNFIKITQDYTVTTEYDLILVDTSVQGDVEVTLPDPELSVKKFIICKYVDALGSVIVSSSSGLIGGESSQEFSEFNDALVVYSDGTNYIIG